MTYGIIIHYLQMILNHWYKLQYITYSISELNHKVKAQILDYVSLIQLSKDLILTEWPRMLKLRRTFSIHGRNYRDKEEVPSIFTLISLWSQRSGWLNLFCRHRVKSQSQLLYNNDFLQLAADWPSYFVAASRVQHRCIGAIPDANYWIAAINYRLNNNNRHCR